MNQDVKKRKNKDWSQEIQHDQHKRFNMINAQLSKQSTPAKPS